MTKKWVVWDGIECRNGTDEVEHRDGEKECGSVKREESAKRSRRDDSCSSSSSSRSRGKSSRGHGDSERGRSHSRHSDARRSHSRHSHSRHSHTRRSHSPHSHHHKSPLRSRQPAPPAAPAAPAAPPQPILLTPEPNTSRAGGVYIPPFKLARLQRDPNDKSSPEYQRQTWEALRKSLNGIINKVNVTNIGNIIPELFQENLVRGRGLFCRAVMKAQLTSPGFTHVYAALVAIVNTKLPEVGELLLKRVVFQFRRAFKRNDKVGEAEPREN